MPIYGKQYDPDDWDGFILDMTCTKCGHKWTHRVKEMDIPPAPGETITVTTSFACPKCGVGGTGTVSLSNAGQPRQG